TVSAVGYEPRQVVTGAAERRTGTLTVDLDPAADLVIEVDALGGDLDGNVLQVVRPARGGDPLARTATVLSSAQLEGRRATARGVAAGIAYVRPVGTWCTPFAHGPLTLSPGERRCVVVRPARGCTLTGRIVPARGRTLVDGLRLLRADGRMTLPQPF